MNVMHVSCVYINLINIFTKKTVEALDHTLSYCAIHSGVNSQYVTMYGAYLHSATVDLT